MRNKMMATAKTNAVRLLDSLGVRYELRSYDVDPDDLAAETVAQKIGMPLEQVFKTLVARGDKHGVCLAVVPGDCELDLKALAKTTGSKVMTALPAAISAWATHQGRLLLTAALLLGFVTTRLTPTPAV